MSLSWAFSDVPSPAMDPRGKRPPLRGHEKGSGRLSQHSALAWGLLKAQTHILPDYIFPLSSASLSVLPHLPVLKRKNLTLAYTHGQSDYILVLIFFPPMSD